VIDVRDTGEYEAGTLPARSTCPSGQLTERLKEFEKFKGRR